MKPLTAKIHHRYEGVSVLHDPVTCGKDLESAINWLERNGTEVSRVELYGRGGHERY